MAYNFYITFLMMILGAFFAYGQEDILTGPRAKNRKPWKNPKPQSMLVIKDHDHEPIMGPLAKNRRPFEDVCETMPIVFRERRKLTGGLAKNARPERGNYWEKEK
jgi:hypothetical protein